MATTLTVLCPNGRRVAVKASPSTSLLKVLEEACQRHKLDPSQHTLKHGGKTLDLSSLLRYTTLPKNAHLEMVPANRAQVYGEITVAIQCVDGSRYQATFTDSTISLWTVLQEVGVVSQPRDGTPVVVYMNAEVCGEDALREKSLKDLGLTQGRAALRFLERQTRNNSVTTPTEPPSVSITKEQATEAASEKAHDEAESSSSVAMETTPTNQAIDVAMETTSDDEQPRSKPHPQQNTEYYFPAHPISYFPQETATPSETTPTVFDVSTINTKESSAPLDQLATALIREHLHNTTKMGLRPTPARVYDDPCDRERVVYHLENQLPLPPQEELSDEFFSVTQRDVLLMQDDLRKQVSAEDAPLMTSAMREVKRERRMEGYSQAVVRVHLPDRWVLQGLFRPHESLKALVQFVRENLADRGLRFHLYTTPPKTVLKSGRVTFLEAGFVPRASVYLGVEGDVVTPILSQATLKSAESALQAEIAIANKRSLSNQSHSSLPPTQSTWPLTTPTLDEGHKSAEPATSGKPIPKWFKLSK